MGLGLSTIFAHTIGRRLAPTSGPRAAGVGCRAILAAAVLAVPGAAVAQPVDTAPSKKWAPAGDEAPVPGTREVPWLHFVHLYTGDALPVFGEQASSKSLERLLRCRATGRTMTLEPGLAQGILAAAKGLKGTVVEVLSGYRSEKFNEQLRKKGHEVASESFHRKGLAIDWRLQNVPLAKLAAWLKRHHQGGLGTYRQSNFVHTDAGPKREWRGR